MSLRQEDFGLVKAVLMGEVSLEEVAKTYSARDAFVIAYVILYASTYDTIFGRGNGRTTYTEALLTICQYPAIPIEGFTAEAEGGNPWPQWYVERLSWQHRFIEISRRLKMHSSNGRGSIDLVLTEQPDIDDFLAQHDLRQKAQELYRVAFAYRQQQLDYKAVQKRRRDSMLAELKNLQTPLYMSLDIWGPVHSEELRVFSERLTALVNKYYPADS